MAFSPDSAVAAQWEDLTIYQNHDADLTITLLNPLSVTPQVPNGTPYNLTGLTVTLTRKASRDVPDSTGVVYECTVQSPPTSGIATVTLPAVTNTAVGVDWYRVDVTGSETKAVKFGRLTVYAV
jgi:hypothetical protein